MKFTKYFLCIAVTLAFYSNGIAQPRSPGDKFEDGIFEFGFVGGANSSGITHAEQIIISEPYFTGGEGINYEFNNTHINRFRAGAFGNFIFHLSATDDATWFFNVEASYSRDGTQLTFKDNHRDYHYNILFDYEFANIQFLMGGKIGGLNIGAGPEFSFNVSPSAINFKSWGDGKLDEFGTDISQKQQLRNVLFGKNNFGIVGAIGYQIFPFLDVEARYHIGLKNIIEVQPNSYNWVQQPNHNNNVQLVLKYYLTERNPIRNH